MFIGPEDVKLSAVVDNHGQLIEVDYIVGVDIEKSLEENLEKNQEKARETVRAASTSLGVWTPRYILEKPIRRNAAVNNTFRILFPAFIARGANRQVPPCV